MCERNVAADGDIIWVASMLPYIEKYIDNFCSKFAIKNLKVNVAYGEGKWRGHLILYKNLAILK